MNRFLIIFFMLFINLLFYSCHEEIDYVVKADWNYINNSSHKISVLGRHDTFDIDINEIYIIKQEGDGSKDVTESAYVPPFFSFDTKIIYDGEVEVILSNGEGITDTKNYESEKIGTRYYKFTYIFTDDDYPVGD